MNTTAALSLMLPLFVAPFAACHSSDGVGDTDATSGDTDTNDLVADTDQVDTDVPAVCGDGAPASGQLCFGSATPVAEVGEGTFGAIAVADWDGGAGADVVFGRNGSLDWLPGDGAGAFAAEQAVTGAEGIGSAVLVIGTGQLNDDSYADLVVGGTDGSGRILFGDGEGGVADQQGTTSGEGALRGVSVADLAGSGSSQDFLDADDYCGGVVATSGDTGASYRFDTVAVCTADVDVLARTSAAHTSVVATYGTTLATSPLTVAVDGLTLGDATNETLSSAVTAMVAADLDGDGDDEVAVLHADGTVDVLFSDGADGWASQGADDWVTYTVGGGASGIAVADLDGDGDLDLALPATTDDAIAVLINDGSGTFSQTSIPLATGAAPSLLAAGDLNGDGVADLAFRTLDQGQRIVVLISQP